MGVSSSSRCSTGHEAAALARLQHRVAELEHLLDAVDGIVWEADARTFQFCYVSCQAERLLGYPRERWTNEPTFWTEHLHPEDRDQAVEYCVEATREAKDHEFEYRMIASDGRSVWLHDIVSVDITDPAAPMLRGLMIDVTSRRERDRRLARQSQALLALAKSEQLAQADFGAFTRFALEMAADTLEVERLSIWLFHEDGSVLRCEDQFEKSAGRHSSGIELEAAKYPRYFAALSEGRFVAADDARTDPKTREFNELYLTPLGISSMLDAPIRLGGEIIGVVCHEHVGDRRSWTADERDFAAAVSSFVSLVLETQRRHDAEQRARSAQELLLAQQRGETERAERELDRIRDQLVQKTRLSTIGQVAASIAHELRNPLGAIRNAGYYLTRRLPADAGKSSQHLDIIEQEVNTADRIISNLLEMTRAKAPAVRELDLAPAARRALDRVDTGQEIRLQLRAQPDPFVLHADAEQFRQVLGNLFTNSVQAMQGRGTILVTARRGEHYDRIVVQDDGPGIPADSRDVVFEPLYTTKAKGTGLGLPICRQILEKHGGTIECAAQTGRGARFCIRLPRRPS